jgi:hypothetical protein
LNFLCSILLFRGMRNLHKNTIKPDNFGIWTRAIADRRSNLKNWNLIKEISPSAPE